MSSFTQLLTPAEATLFKELQDSSLLPELSKPGEGELVQIFKKASKERQEKEMAPYADILATELKSQLEIHKDTIVEQLRSSKTSYFSVKLFSYFSVKLFSWNTVYYNETLDQMRWRRAGLTYDELQADYLKTQARDKTIEENGWESFFHVDKYVTHDDEYGNFWEDVWPSLYAVKIDRIFRHSDLALRLSAALGPNFYPSFSTEYIEGAGEEGETGYRAYKKTLYVEYHPFGLPRNKLLKVLESAKNQYARRFVPGMIRELKHAEVPVGHKKMCCIGEA